MGKEHLFRNAMEEKSGSISRSESISDALNEKSSNDENHFEFERLISGFSSTIIGLPIEDLRYGLETWLKRFAQFFGADRIAVSELNKDEHCWMLFQSYTDPSLSIPPIPPVADIKSFLPSLYQRIKKGEILVVNSVLNDLPESEWQLPLVKEGTKSFISMVLIAKDEIVGVFTIGIFRYEKQWTGDYVRRVKLIGAIITNALMRRRTALNLAIETNKRKNYETRYTAFLKTVNVGFWITDLNHNILEVNDTYCAMTGYHRDELLSLKVCDVDVDHTVKTLEEKVNRIKQNKSVRFDSRHRCRDGSIIDVNINGKLIENGNDIVIYCSIRDITDFKRVLKENDYTLRALQDSEERFRSIFDGAMDGIILSDTSTKQIVMANRAMCRMLGYTTAEIASLRIDDIHPAEALAKRVLPFLTKK